jgi:hypothetical protein
MTQNGYYLIYGGGKFAHLAVKRLRTKYSLLILDTDKECLIGQDFVSTPIPELKEILTDDKLFNKFIQSDTLNQPDISDHQKSFLFTVGEIPLLEQILQIRKPLYLLPIAPIHVMMELIKDYLSKQIPSIQIISQKPTISTKLFPEELFSFEIKNTLYFSYAKWDEKCPENCPAPLDYCHVHHRKKPKTVREILEDLKSQSNLLSFESTQLAPGLGGINGESLFKEMPFHVKNIKNLKENQEYSLLISTSCRCHGVVDAFKILIDD